MTKMEVRRQRDRMRGQVVQGPAGARAHSGGLAGPAGCGPPFPDAPAGSVFADLGPKSVFPISGLADRRAPCRTSSLANRR